ncbi:MAG TPA: DUF748 domain-containing protein [Phycisphaerae bacterium]|nr:DUF748 domain-containing protein [Phycisphaerae bacterium]
MSASRAITPPASPAPPAPEGRAAASAPAKRRHPHRWRNRILFTFLFLVVALVAVRLALPTWVRWYVNKTIDRSPLYRGTIGDVSIHLWRGGYTIHDVRLDKTTGNVPVPFFSAKRVDLHLEWDALLSGKVVGHVTLYHPELNFVDSKNAATSQTGNEGASDSGGGGGPWLGMIRDLFPFQINSAVVHNGEIHFRAFDTNPPVDVYLNNVEASVDNLTNIHDETKPLITTISATALAMNQAHFEFNMKLDPFSYRPTFQLATRLVGLDVTQINPLAQAYGDFDFEKGYFDLVVELNAKEGSVEGYIKPLFRNLQIFSLRQDMKKDNVLQFFWEALVGGVTKVLTNPPRDQFATYIPVSGNLDKPSTDILATVGNVLRNAFIRAYLPRFQGVAPDSGGLEFAPGTDIDPSNPVYNTP